MIPTYSDVDYNGHVNNARYANYAMDAYNPGEGRLLKSFQIDYRYEVLPDAPLRMYTQDDGDIVFAKGIREDDNIAFMCAMEFE